MPHYKDGSPAKIGDLVQTFPQQPTYTARVLGILVSITTGSETCNGQVLPVARKWAGSQWIPVLPVHCDCVTLKECLPIQSEEPAAAAA